MQNRSINVSNVSSAPVPGPPRAALFRMAKVELTNQRTYTGLVHEVRVGGIDFLSVRIPSKDGQSERNLFVRVAVISTIELEPEE
jgi:hypothetical protein